MPTKMPSKTALSMVVSGTYQRQTWDTNAITWVEGTEYEIDTALYLKADSGKDELLSWARGNIYIFDTGQSTLYEWMIVRCNSADATQDMNDSDVMETLQKQKRILKRGIKFVSSGTNYSPSPVNFELFQVGIPDGEELRMVMRPMKVSGGATGNVYALLEWRIQGQ